MGYEECICEYLWRWKPKRGVVNDVSRHGVHAQTEEWLLSLRKVRFAPDDVREETWLREREVCEWDNSFCKDPILHVSSSRLKASVEWATRL